MNKNTNINIFKNKTESLNLPVNKSKEKSHINCKQNKSIYIFKVQKHYANKYNSYKEQELLYKSSSVQI